MIVVLLVSHLFKQVRRISWSRLFFIFRFFFRFFLDFLEHLSRCVFIDLRNSRVFRFFGQLSFLLEPANAFDACCNSFLLLSESIRSLDYV